jgi:ELP3 family radical SAM enzyme/protein acetyltransferase
MACNTAAGAGGGLKVEVDIEDFVPSNNTSGAYASGVKEHKLQLILEEVIAKMEDAGVNLCVTREKIQKWVDTAMRRQKTCFPKTILLDYYLRQTQGLARENTLNTLRQTQGLARESESESERTRERGDGIISGGGPRPLPYYRKLHIALIRKLAKSYSGVSVLSVLTSAKPEYTDKKTGEKKVQDFSCPHQCIYCPTEPGQPKSYLSGEPAVSRAIRCGYDTYEQVMDRSRALMKNGHQVDKVEYIVLGGTWSSYPVEYQEEFIRDLYYSANVMYENCADGEADGGAGEGAGGGAGAGGVVGKRRRLSLAEELKRNETAKCRVIGLTLETRPDTINQKEIVRLRSYGCTRVQLGVQHTHDDVLRAIRRGCKDKHTINAIKMLKDAGFKVDIHLMPDLPGSTYEKDADMMTNVIEKQEYQVDHHKWYPTAVVDHSELKQLYEREEYKPWAEGQEGHDRLFDLFARMYMLAPPWIRINRIIRDIPKPDILGGNNNVTMRQDLDRYLAREGLRPREIRTREVKSADVSWDDVKLLKRSYMASWCKEYFISFEDTKNDTLLGFIKLRLPHKKNSRKHYIPALRGSALIRELHVYGILSVVGDTSGGEEKVQHRGLGRRLLAEAEKIAYDSGYGRTSIIAGVGVRQYYRKFGYVLADTYMNKDLYCRNRSRNQNQNRDYLLKTDQIELIILLILVFYILVFMYTKLNEF